MTTSVFIVGAGAVGGSLAVAFSQSAVEVVGLYDVDQNRAENLARATRTKCYFGEFPTDIKPFDVGIIAVPDSIIPLIAEQLAQSRFIAKEQVWLHVAGALPADVLGALSGRVRGIGAFHPALVFSPGQLSPIPAGTRFAIDGDETARAAANTLARKIGGTTVFVPADQRVVYHAAMVMASNYVVALLHQAATLLEQTGMSREQAEQLISGLTGSALERAQKLGLGSSLSGPIQRGDTTTVERHLAALAFSPKIESTYRTMGTATLDLALDQCSLTPDKREELVRLLDDATVCDE